MASESLDDFTFLEINGMKLTQPQQSYSMLWESLSGKNLPAATALNFLEKRFSKTRKRESLTIVLLDELDVMVTRKQTVMYNFLDWANRSNSGLVVIAVANTMDLPERVLSNRYVPSRLPCAKELTPGVGFRVVWGCGESTLYLTRLSSSLALYLLALKALTVSTQMLLNFVLAKSALSRATLEEHLTSAGE